MKIPLHFSVGTLIFAGSSFTAFAEQKWDLHPRWDAAYRYHVESQTEDISKLPDPKLSEIKTNMTSVMSVAVDPENASGHKAVHFSVDHLTARIRSAAQEVQYDSADPAKSPPFYQQVFGAVTNRHLVVLYNKDDQFQGVQSLDGAAAPTPPVGSLKGLSEAQLAELFRKSFELGLPSQAVGPGDTWVFTDVMDLGPIVGQVQCKISATFDSTNEHDGAQYAKILLNGQLTSSADNTATPAPVKILEGSTLTGELTYDLTHHVIVDIIRNSGVKLSIEGKEASVSEKEQTKVSLSPVDKK